MKNVIALVVFTGALLAGCVPLVAAIHQPFMDKSTFTGIPCAAPCWQGLVIGQSNESKVVATLSGLASVDQSSVNIHKMSSMQSLDFHTYAPGVEITANCAQPGIQCLTLDIVDNILTEIDVPLNYDIQLDEAIRDLGEPDYIGYNYEVEIIHCQVYLVWAKQQLVLASEKFQGADAYKENCGVVDQHQKIASTLKIREAKYLSPTAIAAFHPGDPGFYRFIGILPGK